MSVAFAVTGSSEAPLSRPRLVLVASDGELLPTLDREPDELSVEAERLLARLSGLARLEAEILSL